MQLLQGDCLDVMKTLPDKSVDLFLCDLPYGCLTTQNNNARLMRMENGVATGKKAQTENGLLQGCSWDIKLDLTQFWVQVKRLCKDDHTPVLMFCSTKFGAELITSNPDWFRYDLVWNKMRGVSFLSANKMPMRSHEMIYVFAKKGATYYRTDLLQDNTGKRCVLSIVESSTRKKGQHPTQKPDDLYAWLITRYSKEGDTILDPTAGSFASVFTAHRLNRNAIGIEKDKTFYETAIRRRDSD